MIKLENVVLPSAVQMQFVIEGMRNPFNSWDNSDSVFCDELGCGVCDYSDKCEDFEYTELGYNVGKNDLTLMKRLAKAGTDHRKYLRMMPIMVRITAPLYWVAEHDTYKVSTVRNSCSFMHKGVSKPFEMSDFSWEIENALDLAAIVERLNQLREKYLITKKDADFIAIRQLLPSGYNVTYNWSANYEVLANIYHSRKNHRLPEWRAFCEWVESLPYSELITGEDKNE